MAHWRSFNPCQGQQGYMCVCVCSEGGGLCRKPQTQILLKCFSGKTIQQSRGLKSTIEEIIQSLSRYKKQVFITVSFTVLTSSEEKCCPQIEFTCGPETWTEIKNHWAVLSVVFKQKERKKETLFFFYPEIGTFPCCSQCPSS